MLFQLLIHWYLLTHICINKFDYCLGSGNGLVPNMCTVKPIGKKFSLFYLKFKYLMLSDACILWPGSSLMQVIIRRLFGANSLPKPIEHMNNYTKMLPMVWRAFFIIETFSAVLVLCGGNPPVTGGFPLQRPVTRSFKANIRDAGDLRRHRSHYNVTVMVQVSAI